MKGRWSKYLLGGLVIAVLAGCSSRPTDRGQQYKDGRLDNALEYVNEPNATGKPVNALDYSNQVAAVQIASSSLYGRNNTTFQAVEQWLRSGADTRNLSQYGISAYQMEGADNFGNVQLTGYYTPWYRRVIRVRVNSSIRCTVCRQNAVVCLTVPRFIPEP